jgi:hypothetical protein
MMKNKHKTKTISKGYRLHNSTHKIISKIRKTLGCTTDEALSNACTKFYNEIINKKSQMEGT